VDLMRALLLAGTLLLLTSCLAGKVPPMAEPPRFAGVLSGETVWSGTIFLDGDLLVPPGSTLRIQAGTTVLVYQAEGTKIDPEYLSVATELLVRGTLLVEGTAERPVRFLPAKAVAEGELLWAGIILDGASDSAVRGAEIESAETGLLCIGSSPTVEGNLFSRCRYGIIAQHGSAPQLLHNRIEQGEAGIFCWWQSDPYLHGNRIADNAEEGIFVDAGSRPRFGGNDITGNDIGLALYARDLDLTELRFSGNRQDLLYLGGTP
jgi:parallel beta-helix repeat protein